MDHIEADLLDQKPPPDYNKWPPRGYVARTELKDKKGVSASVVDHWEKRERKHGALLDKDIVYRESAKGKAFSEEWLDQQMKKYKPRTKSS